MKLQKRGLLVCLILALALLFTGAAAQSVTPVYLGDSSAITTVTLRVATLEGEILFDGPVAVVDDNPHRVHGAEKPPPKPAGAGRWISPARDTPDMMFFKTASNDLIF